MVLYLIICVIIAIGFVLEDECKSGSDCLWDIIFILGSGIFIPIIVGSILNNKLKR